MSDIDVLLTETRTFPPPDEFRARAFINSETVADDAARDPESYWAKMAATLEWIAPWKTVLDWKPPHAKWFIGGKLYVAANCVDRHIRGSTRNKAAIIWEGEPGDRRTLTYWDLYREVQQFANVLKSLGVGKGDRVGIYLPLIPECAVAMLVDLLQRDPYSFDGLIALGETLLEVGRKADAGTAFRRVLAFDADHVGAIFYDGVLLADQKRYREAVAQWSRVVDLEPAGEFARRARRESRTAADLQKVFGERPEGG